MFARAHHPAMRHAAPVRQELGIRTVFNILGPLANPAGACDGVFGVYSPALARPTPRRSPGSAPAARSSSTATGARRALARAGRTSSSRSSTATIREWELDPRDARHLPRRRPTSSLGGTPAENADAVRRVLAGEPGGRRDAVLLNAAAALVAAGLADDLGEGVGARRPRRSTPARRATGSSSWSRSPRRRLV